MLIKNLTRSLSLSLPDPLPHSSLLAYFPPPPLLLLPSFLPSPPPFFPPPSFTHSLPSYLHPSPSLLPSVSQSILPSLPPYYTYPYLPFFITHSLTYSACSTFSSFLVNSLPLLTHFLSHSVTHPSIRLSVHLFFNTNLICYVIPTNFFFFSQHVIEVDENPKTSIKHLVSYGVGVWVSVWKFPSIKLFHGETLKHVQDISIVSPVTNMQRGLLKKKKEIMSGNSCVSFNNP